MDFETGVRFNRKTLYVDEGVGLSYIDVGSGPTVVMLPGLSGSVSQFRFQIEALQDEFRVVALDPRGHGESDKPPTGYNYHRLAKDLDEFLAFLALSDVTLYGHSAGCKIIWTYWEIFDRSRVRGLILSDDAPCNLCDGTFTPEQMLRLVEGLSGPDADDFTKDLILSLVSDNVDPQILNWKLSETHKLPRLYHAKLMRWAGFGDWWDAVGLIDVPTLLIGGRHSRNPWQNMVKMHEVITQSELVIFESDEGGSHSMYLENPQKYTAHMRQFLCKLYSQTPDPALRLEDPGAPQ